MEARVGAIIKWYVIYLAAGFADKSLCPSRAGGFFASLAVHRFSSHLITASLHLSKRPLVPHPSYPS